ncbi:inverse autotransporter beta domain-containing protein, partial [Aeromonas sp. R2-4]|uniref:inverse autotransporter beta domain-containing protein n=1 Tax=Aeromonas sp. R2-4 TaxID=3138462 RepID=UPI0034A4B331
MFSCLLLFIYQHGFFIKSRKAEKQKSRKAEKQKSRKAEKQKSSKAAKRTNKHKRCDFMSRDEIRGNKWLSSLLISLQLFQVVVPSFLGVTKAIASDLPELGSSQAVKGEQSLLAKDMDDYLATQAIRLAAPFNEGTKIDLTDEDTYASKFHSTLSNSQFKSHEENATRISVDSERDYWINQANSLASSYVTTYVDSALSNDFGTVKSVVDLDNELQLSGYSLDALYSLYDDEHNTVFFQSGIRKNSESNRNFFNFGVGHRYVDNTWMIGYNSFFDHELKRGHNRLGFGLEGAADHFKAALNYYHPLSSWKSSVDLDEYEERPAKGIDARLKAYLPSYPQLAATATHEQYFGNEIAIQSANKLEKSPYSSALGIEWTPFPFVTAGLANKWTKNAGSELGIELSFNFKLGSSFSQLFNSSQVLKDRLVTGMRHDLVERNNEIVLQYRKKSSNVAVSHAAIYGQSGQVLQLSPVITGGAEITSWHWRAVSPLGMPDLLQGFNDVSIPSPLVTLPLLPVDTLIAEYTLYLDVTLRNGQVISSEPISTIVHADVAAFERQVKVTSHPNGVINLSSVPVTGVANRSSDPITVEWVLERKLGDTVLSVAPIESVIKTTDPALIVEVQSGRPSDDGGWINAFTLLSNGVKQTREQLLGHVSIQAKSIASLPLVETALDIVADSNPVHFQDATLSIVSNNAVADGSATNSVRAIVVDASGSGLSGQRVSFSADSGATVINTEVVTDEQGVAETTVSSLTPGLSTVTAQLDNGKRAFALISFQESLVPGDFKDHALIVENDGVLADGHMTNVVKATVVDDSDAPMAGLNVSFRASNGAIMQDVVVTTDTQGIARGRLTSLTAGLSTVTAQLDNGKQANASVTFSSDVQITAGNMTVETDNAQADGAAKNKVQVIVTRADGSVVENEPVTFSADNGASLVGSNPVTTDASG